MRAGSTSVITRRSSRGWYPSGCRRKLKSQIKDPINGNLPTTKYLEALLWRLREFFYVCRFPTFQISAPVVLYHTHPLPSLHLCDVSELFWCTYCGCVRITAVECGQSYPSINIIQQVTSINTKWDGARGSDLGRRIGEREEAGSVDFYPYRNGGLVLFYLLIAVAVYHQTFSYTWGYLYFIFEKCTCNWSPAWTGLRCTGPPVITVALANDEGRSNGTNVRRIQLDGISYLL